MTKSNGRYIVYKGGHNRKFQWCAARVESGMLHVLYQHPDWAAAMTVAVLSSEGRINEFGKWIADYNKALIEECETLKRKMDAA
jgi:hypothetical protein